VPPFLEALSNRLTDRWLATSLPGVPLIGMILVAMTLGHRHWADMRRLTGAADRLSAGLSARPGTTTAIVVVLALLAAGTAGVLARGFGGLLRTVWTRPWPRWGQGLTARRRRRWQRLQDEYERQVLAQHGGAPVDEERVNSIGRERNRLALTEPERPTWMADRLAASEARVRAEYGVDLAAAWPRLWLLLGEDGRAPVRQAATALDAAAVLSGWGVLYLVVGVQWWPSALVGAAAAVTGWWRARRAVATYAELTEAVVDLHLTNLAEHLGLAAADIRDAGPDISSRLRKGA
jgi:hypothetical protein